MNRCNDPTPVRGKAGTGREESGSAGGREAAGRRKCV